MLPDNIPQGLEDGRLRNLRALTKPDFSIPEIAARLAKINRFAGATRFPLSVATHSVVVSYLAPEGFDLTGLLHDITESFGIGDLISPVKQVMPGYKELEKDIYRQLCKPFPVLKDIEHVERADKRATAIEAYNHRGHWPDWASAMGAAHELSKYETYLARTYYHTEWSWRESRDEFIRRFEELTNAAYA